MAKKGLSKLVIADRTVNGSVVTYSNPVVQEKLAEYSTEIEAAEANNLFLDNEIAESDGGTFQSGTINLTTGDLSNETSQKLYKTKENEVTYSGDKTVKELVYDDALTNQELAVGIIELHQVDNIDSYRAIFFPKVKFNVHSDSATTKGETIEWQTQEINGTIYRSEEVDDRNIHPWKYSADFTNEADALAYLMFKGGKGA